MPGMLVKIWAMPTASVLIADDHAVVRAGLRQLLGEDSVVGEIGEAVLVQGAAGLGG